ncbi:preprotein translocase subunit SecA [Acinetobacter sp.]|uniref:preprotein translocase subunit SecA n=1 Tax=Acinetobacter sp. TaxID=472 RepID=UPI0035B3B113
MIDQANTDGNTPNPNQHRQIDHTTTQWKMFLVYDVIMMVLIVLNLIVLGLQALILSDFGAWIAEVLNITTQRSAYIQQWDPIIRHIDQYFIIFLIVELGVRWLIAIIGKHHRRWWFFPFIHWYEVIAIIPQLRFFRLLRAGVIAYRLHELGYKVIPHNMINRGKFYYDLVMEELTSRIVLTVLSQVEKELKDSDDHNHRIHQLIDRHRDQFANVLAMILQKSLATALSQHQQNISQNIGQIVHQAIDDTPELVQLLKLMPIVGSRIESLIQTIGQQLGENITQGIIAELSAVQSPNRQANPLLTEVAQEISQVQLNYQQVDDLVDSVVKDSLELIREQVKVKQWQQIIDETQQ